MSDFDNIGWDDMGCYLERDIYTPRQDSEHDWSHLDGQEYQPAPYLVEDDRTGYDQDGNYHVERNGASMDSAYTPHYPYRIAQEVQEFVVRMAELEDHDIGRIERDEIASAYILHLIDQNAFTDEMVAFQALQIWRTQHGRDLRG